MRSKRWMPLLGFLVSVASARTEALQTTRSVHAYVALCDNLHQGIVPVPASLGNGQDPSNNLYWGARYGLKSFFRRAAHWKLLQCGAGPSAAILERCVFRHSESGTLLLADAYDGATIRTAIEEFVDAAAGGRAETLDVKGESVKLGGVRIQRRRPRGPRVDPARREGRKEPKSRGLALALRRLLG
jgi:hypothetical protein